MTRIGDMKAGLTSSRPKMSIIGRHAAVYDVRGKEYGADKYARGNYHGPPPDGVTPEARVIGYLDALIRHATAITQAYNEALGTGGDTRAAIAVADLEASGGFPASGLPHLAHLAAGIDIAIECAVQDGLVPADPGQPWKISSAGTAGREDSLAQKDDPAAERARVARLREIFDRDEREQSLGPLPEPVPDLDDERHPASGPHTILSFQGMPPGVDL